MAHKVTRVRYDFKRNSVQVTTFSQNARGSKFAVGRFETIGVKGDRVSYRKAIKQATELALSVNPTA
jgi:hypothetical protein